MLNVRIFVICKAHHRDEKHHDEEADTLTANREMNFIIMLKNILGNSEKTKNDIIETIAAAFHFYEFHQSTT